MVTYQLNVHARADAPWATVRSRVHNEQHTTTKHRGWMFNPNIHAVWLGTSAGSRALDFNQGAPLQMHAPNSVEQSHSWGDNSSSARQKIPPFLWDPNVHYCVHKSPPLDPIVNQFNPVHSLRPFSFKIHLRLSLWSDLFSLDSRSEILYELLISPTRAICPTQLIILDLFALMMQCLKKRL